jgi:hypothetical protein
MYNELYEKKKSQEAVYEARIRELEEQCEILRLKVSEFDNIPSAKITERKDDLRQVDESNKNKGESDTDVKSVAPLTEGLSKLEAKALQVRVRIYFKFNCSN